MPILNWLNKEQALTTARNCPYRLLEPVQDLSYGDQSTENMLIQGDNLEALKALIPTHAGRVKCIFIDPPYNTKSAFEHYDDNLEHSKWLSMMYPRLELLHQLLAEDGSIWISLDDNEAHYLKVMCDEIFGRSNFVANCLWQKAYSERMDTKGFSTSHDHIFVYRKSNSFEILPLQKEQNKKQFNYFDEKVGKFYRRRSLRKEGSESLRKDRPSMWYSIKAPDGSDVYPLKPDKTEGRWRWKEDNVTKRRDELEIIKKNRVWEIYVKQYLEDTATRPPATLMLNAEVGHNHEAKLESKIFNSLDVFDTPKPERLIQRILTISSHADDLILDSFLGSGTTAAVAHKMNRKFIGIELGEHAVSHCQPRLQKVIDGEQGGISKDVNWQGGGGFKFYRLGEVIFNENGSLREGISFNALAAHIWYGDTRISFEQKEKTPLLGVHNGIAYYLLYNGILGDKRPDGGNVLTSKVLAILPAHPIDAKNGKKVIYGETSRMGEARLKSENIVFKQIPYDVRGR
ncbi:site-specific DNA-methyltransferase [Shewanella vesiculosa]|uniref:site-specific DNA-methyltransferase n=1 Tax=Shewanella vesiculosa TaxID=518738 RepID=UPI003D07713B